MMLHGDELLLRRLLWLRHGCPCAALYGDDGEMQCHACVIDFRRDTPEQIDARFMEINDPVIAAYFKSLRKE
jgi:hypothetical protein